MNGPEFLDAVAAHFPPSLEPGAAHTFETIEEAQEFATDWLGNCNKRPNMGMGGITPGKKLKMAA